MAILTANPWQLEEFDDLAKLISKHTKIWRGTRTPVRWSREDAPEGVVAVRVYFEKSTRNVHFWCLKYRVTEESPIAEIYTKEDMIAECKALPFYKDPVHSAVCEYRDRIDLLTITETTSDLAPHRIRREVNGKVSYKNLISEGGGFK